MFEDLLSGLEYFLESLRSFQGQSDGMLELDFEPLFQRSAEVYAEAYAAYFTDMAAAGEPFSPGQEFSQSFPAQLGFVPMAHPTKAGKALLTEKVKFCYLSHFLYTDFYQGLMAGNAPRRCHNCGRYFLPAARYNTYYCSIIAPGETEHTCRKGGAHRKEAQGNANRPQLERSMTGPTIARRSESSGERSGRMSGTPLWQRSRSCWSALSVES